MEPKVICVNDTDYNRDCKSGLKHVEDPPNGTTENIVKEQHLTGI